MLDVVGVFEHVFKELSVAERRMDDVLRGDGHVEHVENTFLLTLRTVRLNDAELTGTLLFLRADRL